MTGEHFSSLVLHPHTAAALDDMVRTPTHAVLLSGAAGTGKATLARTLCQALLVLSPAAYDNYPHIRVIRPDEGRAIPIEKIRELQHFTSLKIPGTANHAVSRIIIIEEAHLLTTEAQNALLKTLEEPPEQTVLVLTSPGLSSVLPTIQSRVRNLSILPPDRETLEVYFKAKGFSAADIDRSIMLSGALPGLTAALLEGDAAHPLVLATSHARGILQSKTYERLLLVDTLSKDKQLCLDILFVLGQMARMALLRSSDQLAGKRWKHILEASYAATMQLQHNTQAKLVLSNLMLEI